MGRSELAQAAALKIPANSRSECGFSFYKKALTRNSGANPASNLVINDSIHHNRFIGWTVYVPLFIALGPLYLIIDEDLDDYIAPEYIVGA